MEPNLPLRSPRRVQIINLNSQLFKAQVIKGSGPWSPLDRDSWPLWITPFPDLLWGDQILTPAALMGRFERGMSRLRSTQVKVRLVNHHVFFESSTSCIKVDYRPGESAFVGKSFLELQQGSSFRRADVETHFSLKRSKANDLIKDWIARKLVRKTDAHNYCAMVSPS